MEVIRTCRTLYAVAGVALCVLAGCDPSNDAVGAARGGEGESCAARSDCDEGLICLDNRCLRDGASLDKDADAGTERPTDTRGTAGESCTRRADCTTNLLCVANVCVEGPASHSDMQSPLGDRGESCQARNDCAAGLACVMNRCVIGQSSVPVLQKQCFRVQCELDEDCCKTFVAPLNCATLKMSCSAGDTTACTTYNASCTCNQACKNSLCIPVRKCSMDTDCAVATERCFAGQCAQCGSDTDCTVAGQRCISGICRAGCERNEQCPIFSECKAHECTVVGCKSDRECYFATKSPLARCVERACVTPCSTDAQCPDLQACRDAKCVPVGCESNEECRIMLNLASVPGNERAVCRMPDR